MVYAARRRRAVALVLDVLIFFALWIGASIVLEVFLDRRMSGIVSIAMLLTYFAATTGSTWQGTPGKLLLRIKVTGLQGERIGFLRATLRLAATLLSIALFGLGFAVAFWNGKRRALHDFIAGTVVVGAKAAPEEIAAENPLPPSWPARIGKTALFIVILAVPVYLYEFGLHGREARAINERNFREAALVVAALDAYKQKNGRYPESLALLQAGYLDAAPKLDERVALHYSSSPAGDACWLAIVFWMRAGVLPSDDANEYDCASRQWRIVDYNELKAGR